MSDEADDFLMWALSKDRDPEVQQAALEVVVKRPFVGTHWEEIIRSFAYRSGDRRQLDAISLSALAQTGDPEALAELFLRGMDKKYKHQWHLAMAAFEKMEPFEKFEKVARNVLMNMWEYVVEHEMAPRSVRVTGQALIRRGDQRSMTLLLRAALTREDRLIDNFLEPIQPGLYRSKRTLW